MSTPQLVLNQDKSELSNFCPFKTSSWSQKEECLPFVFNLTYYFKCIFMLYLSLNNGSQGPASMSFLYISFSCRITVNVHIAVGPSHLLSFQPALTFVMLSVEFSSPMQRILPNLLSRLLLKISPTMISVCHSLYGTELLIFISHNACPLHL